MEMKAFLSEQFQDPMINFYIDQLYLSFSWETLLITSTLLLVNLVVLNTHYVRRIGVYLTNIDNKQENSVFSSSILIDALIDSRRAVDMQANLAEVFPLWVERHGSFRAKWICKVQIARLIIGEYWNKVLELIKAIKLAGS